jgi:hypothetical protein
MAETSPADPLSSVTPDMIEAARRAGQKITAVIMGPPPAGFVDLFVYQPNPPPELSILKDKGLAAWKKAYEYWQRNQFELPPSFQPISGVSGLVIAVRRACAGGKKLRQLRIMGHGSAAHVSIGAEQVWTSKLIDNQARKTDMARELEKLQPFLDPDKSLVILDHCLCGQDARFLGVMSDLMGGVAVRGYEDYQKWERGEVQIGVGVYRQCKGGTCHEGIEHAGIVTQPAAN